MTSGNRTHLVARLPCGCMVMVITKEDPRPWYHYKAAKKDINAWYRNVEKAREKYTLTITEERDPTEFKCDKPDESCDLKRGRK